MPRTFEVTVKVKLRKLQGDEISDQGYEHEDVTDFDLDSLDGTEIVELVKDAIDSWIGLDAGEPHLLDEGPAAITKVTATTD